ncbi:MAG: hypothetical protein NHB32_14045 [Fischerella sp. CENA71]|nr:hypothetical protein [Fischerella sp. CENA71]
MLNPDDSDKGYSFVDYFAKNVIPKHFIQDYEGLKAHFDNGEAGALMYHNFCFLEESGVMHSQCSFISEKQLLENISKLPNELVKTNYSKLMLRVEYWKRDHKAIPVLVLLNPYVLHTMTVYLEGEILKPLLDGSALEKHETQHKHLSFKLKYPFFVSRSNKQNKGFGCTKAPKSKKQTKKV